MSDHSSSVFNNSCLKIPINPKSHQPLPLYEQKILHHLQNEATKSKMKSVGRNHTKSFMEFFESIPEYDDINHLPDKEFYRKLESLRERQRLFWDYVKSENRFDNDKTTEWVEDYKNFAEIRNKQRKNVITPILTKSSKFCKNVEDTESSCLSEKEKPPSRRSVRIESPSDKYQENSPASDFFVNTKRPKSRVDWDELNTDFKLDLDQQSISQQSKSAPNSPAKFKPTVGWKDDGITIPKPFDMTVRDEENKIVDELMPQKTAKKEEMFKAHPIPIESQIPLFDKIMADQEKKNYVVRERSKALLQSQMRPFSFTRRDEEIQKLTKELSKSSPSLFLDDPPAKVKKFKAKPVPKNLFSNYIYQKMHEDEFYRALQKKIRAEEMLKAASLPPSMARREKYCPKYDVCPRSYKDLFEQEFEELKNDFLTSDSVVKSRRKKQKSKKNKKNRNPSASSSSESRTISSLDLHNINRSNLAALLRVHSARKRLEGEMARRLEECKLKEEARWREKIMRKKPVWQSLAYSHEEDLAMRLQLRRDEERLRSEEHKLRMSLMLGRVNQQPTLFERQSVTRYPICKHDKLQAGYRDFTETKDAAIQALLDEEYKKFKRSPTESDENSNSNS